MQPIDDHALLREYVEYGSEEAFATLVVHHVDKVYSVALRHTRNPHKAEEITQAVFVILAEKSKRLSDRVILSGWLYETARLTAMTYIRSEVRRAHREEAHMQTLLNEAESDPELWPQIAPLLEDAMAGLSQADRHAVVLRFFDGKSAREISATLGTNEDVVRKRLSRAIEKLRNFFARRGISSTTETLASAISTYAVQSAPSALAKTATVMAVAKGTAAGGSTLTLIKGVLKIMSWTKAKTALVVAATLILATGTTVVVVEKTSRIQGKTEAEWIKSIVYFGDAAQTKQWHELGSRGVSMLVRAIRSKTNNHDTRMRSASELEQLGKDAKSALPDVIDILKSENDGGVLAIELTFLHGFIPGMSESDKAAVFPELIRALDSPDTSARCNALQALQIYPQQADTTVPLMVNALQDHNRLVRIYAVKSLIKIDPQNAAASDYVKILVGCITGPPDDAPVAVGEAIAELGDLHRDPETAIPVLIECLQSTNHYVRGNAAAALNRFGRDAQTALPELQNMLSDPDPNVRKHVANIIEHIQSGAAPR